MALVGSPAINRSGEFGNVATYYRCLIGLTNPATYDTHVIQVRAYLGHSEARCGYVFTAYKDEVDASIWSVRDYSHVPFPSSAGHVEWDVFLEIREGDCLGIALPPGSGDIGIDCYDTGGGGVRHKQTLSDLPFTDETFSLYTGAIMSLEGVLGADSQAVEGPFVPVTPTKITVPHTGGAWQDVDLSAYIPTCAIGIVGMFEHSDATATGFGFRMKGSTDDRRANASGSIMAGVVVGCDSERVIQFNSNSSFSQYFYLLAYIIAPNAVINTNATDVSPTSTGAWETVDLSSECPGATGIILEVYTTGGFKAFGARKYGSSDNRINTCNGHNTHDIIIGCDSSQQIQLYKEDANVGFYLRGYIKDGVQFYTDAVEITPTNTGTWEEKATPSGKVDIYRYDSTKQFWLTGYQGADIIFVEVTSTNTSGGAGIREADGTVVPYGYSSHHPWFYSLVTDNDPPDALIEMAFAQSIFTESPSWTDVSDEALSYYVKRGREHDLNRIEAGTAVVVMKNLNGDWYRYYTSGTYYPDVKPLTLIRITLSYGGISYRRFYGVVEGFKHGWLDNGLVPIVTISCVDIFKSFNREKIYPLTGTIGEFQDVCGIYDSASGQKDVILKLTDDSGSEVADITLFHVGQSITIGDDNHSEVNTIASIDEDTYTLTMEDNLEATYQESDNAYVKKFPSVLSGTRINDVRCELGWPSALSDIDAGQCYVAEFVPDADGTPALEHMLAVAESEGGIVFISRSGLLTFQDRDARLSSPYNTFQASFSDDGEDNQYIASGPEDDDTFIYNEARISGDAITAQIYRDATKQLTQGIRIFPKNGSLLVSNLDAFDEAYAVVERYKDSILRIPDFTVIPDKDAPVLYPLILPFDISTRINVEMNTNPNFAIPNRAYHIEGIEEQWHAGELWRAKWQLWDVNILRIARTDHDGFIEATGIVTYAAVHDAASGNTVGNDASYFIVGQQGTATGWIIDRGYLEFDTSIIGSGATIYSAEIIMMITTEGASGTYFTIDNEFDLTLVPATDVDSPLVYADYGDLLDDTTDYGHVTIATPAINRQLIAITLNEAGLAAINKTGITRFGLRSSRDINSNAPGTNEREFIALVGQSEVNAPRLSVKLNEAFA